MTDQDHLNATPVSSSQVATSKLSAPRIAFVRNTTSGAIHERKLVESKLGQPLIPYITSATMGKIPHVIFPLSADHCLITLVQYNVVRSVIFNMSILSILGHLPIGCSNSFMVPVFGTVLPEAIPRDLQPTFLQITTQHEAWIDAIPFPRLRDNLILLAGKYNSTDLRLDLGQRLYEGYDDTYRRGFLVWGQPWSMQGWEVSDGFIQKWGFLLEGCQEVIESTNHWRKIRGEERLVVSSYTGSY
jgi:hypothetical protein